MSNPSNRDSSWFDRDNDEEVSIYPSVVEVESIYIPSCDEVFARVSSFTNCKAGIFDAHSEDLNQLRRTSSSKVFLGDSVICKGGQAKPPPSFSVQSSESATRKPGSVAVSGSGSELERQSSYRKAGQRHQSIQEVEISPGVFLPLHGSEETIQEMESGSLITAICFCCAQRLSCVSLASYVLCPCCRVISPLESSNSGGVGLGLFDKDIEYCGGSQVVPEVSDSAHGRLEDYACNAYVH